ncbi:unnamed protein product [Ilex paraguariensis]|uniref:Uncharacterized protein n=1 Tax=Ilex paraguariensis TaxID=185542 RepID=A0ABC8UM50_9AQUA
MMLGERSSAKKHENSVWCNLCHLEEGRSARILQRFTCPDPEDCAKLSIAFDDKRKDHKDHLGTHASTSELRNLNMEKRNPRTVVSVILGGGADPSFPSDYAASQTGRMSSAFFLGVTFLPVIPASFPNSEYF